MLRIYKFGSNIMPKAKNERFENVYSQGGLSTMEIWVDKETGVNYLFRTVLFYIFAETFM